MPYSLEQSIICISKHQHVYQGKYQQHHQQEANVEIDVLHLLAFGGAESRKMGPAHESWGRRQPSSAAFGWLPVTGSSSAVTNILFQPQQHHHSALSKQQPLSHPATPIFSPTHTKTPSHNLTSCLGKVRPLTSYPIHPSIHPSSHPPRTSTSQKEPWLTLPTPSIR